MDQAFRDAMKAGYSFNEPGLTLGSAMQGTELDNDTRVVVPLSILNRHGLVAGATGTGKTKTLQLLTGQLSKAGVPVFIADIKGDVTGVSAAGDGTNPKVVDRCKSLAWTFTAAGHPAEFLSLSGKLGAQVRATVHSFGPLLLGKVLGLNDTQTSIMSLVFKYCDDNQLPLLDLADLTTALKFLASADGKAALADYGGLSPASLGVILRAIVTMQQAGADAFFGEPEFDVMDLIRLAPNGEGIISVLELSDVMAQPGLFSTFMLWMLAQLYHALPEAGDLPKPKLCFFFDEAHLLFDSASTALLQEIEQTARLIRSKGVGVYFVTQAPTDIPASILAQLGNRVQHALRAFTPQDADNLKKTVKTFPVTKYYDVEQTLQQLGIGEAFVTVLTPSGVPTPLAATRLIPPDSLMGPIPAPAFNAAVAASPFATKYGQTVDRQSAHEIITARIAAAQQAGAAAAGVPGAPGGPTAAQSRATAAQQRAAERQSQAVQRGKQRELETMVRTGGRIITSRAGQDVIRGVLGTLFGGKR